MKINELKPKNVWKFFEEISQIPRCSGDEKAISDYLLDFAKKRNLEARQDEALNIVMRKKASPGFEDKDIIALQAHMDMVCVKEDDSDHDFSKDPIKLIVDGDYVTADKTTLGADDGMGVAYILAVFDDENLKHGPLEAIITTGEETSMVGANALDTSDIKAKYLLNIDSEEDGILTVGCAGGLDLEITWANEFEEKEGQVLKLEISGLSGGHSGMEIDKARLNAIKALGRLLVDIKDLQICDFSAGVKRNAIAANAWAIFTTSDKENSTEEINKRISQILNEYKDTDPNAKISLKESSWDNKALSKDLSKNIINALFTMPDGLVKKHQGEIITSSNLGILNHDENGTLVSLMARSQIDSAKENLANIAIKIVEQFAGKATIKSSYTGWQKEETKLEKVLNKIWKEENGSDMEIATTHGGLECGLFKGTLKEVEMISFGPEIHGAHSPAEEVDIKSVEKNYKLLVRALERI